MPLQVLRWRWVPPVRRYLQPRQCLAQSKSVVNVKACFRCLKMGLANKAPETLEKLPVSLQNPHSWLSLSSMAWVVLSSVTKDSHPKKALPVLWGWWFDTHVPLHLHFHRPVISGNHFPASGHSALSCGNNERMTVGPVATASETKATLRLF